jgi:MFS family permease
VIHLFRQERFRSYTLGKLFQLAGQNALIYGLFILVIERQESSISTSLFVLCSVLPSVLLSIPGGAFADSAPRKPMILLTLAMRMAIILAFIRYDLSLPVVLGLTLLVWSVYQFYSPAEIAALPAVTPQGMMTQANSVMYVASLLAQLGGAGVIAPLALTAFDASGLFVVCLILVFIGAWMLGTTPDLTVAAKRPRREGLLRSLTVGIRFFRRDALSARAMLQFVLLSSATVMVLVAVPNFVQDVLGTAVVNAIYIFSPGAIGIAVGLAVAPLLTRWLGGATVSLLGFVCFAAVLAVLAVVDPVTQALEGWGYFTWARDTLNINARVATTMLVAPFGGLGIALVNVASRALIYERAAPHQLGQLFATQSAIGSIAAVGPTLAAGVIADIVDIRFFLGGVAAVLLVALVPLMRIGRAREHVRPEVLMQDYGATAGLPDAAEGTSRAPGGGA